MSQNSLLTQAMISIIRMKVAYLFVSWWFPILPGHVRKDKMNWLSNTFPIGEFNLKWPQMTKNDPTWPFRSSATTTLRPNIAIVRDSGATQTIVNNAIVNNGSRVPISRNIVKNIDQVQDHIARVNTICSNGSNEVISSKGLNFSWIVLHPSYSSWRHESQCGKAK